MIFGMLKTLDASAVRDFDGAAVRGDELEACEGPVPGVRDRACLVCLEIEVVEFEVQERDAGIALDLKGGFRAGGLDVPDVDVVEVSDALGFGDGSGHDLVVRRRVSDIFGDDGVAVAGVPVHLDDEHGGRVDEGEVVDADVFHEAAAGVG